MTLPSRVIYLPPGVAAPAGTPSAPTSSGVPFDRTFFEQTLKPAIDAFCRQVGCEVPIVEVLTVDGVTHYVNGISGIGDQWVALHTSRPDHPHAIESFVPYQTIFRVEIHPEGDERRRHLGFIETNAHAAAIPEVEPAVAKAGEGAPAKGKR